MRHLVVSTCLTAAIVALAPVLEPEPRYTVEVDAVVGGPVALPPCKVEVTASFERIPQPPSDAMALEPALVASVAVSTPRERAGFERRAARSSTRRTGVLAVSLDAVARGLQR